MIIDNLINTLSGICNNVIEQGSLAADAPYPDRFFTFWNNSSDDHKHYDDTAYGYVWNCDINFYSTSAEDVYSTLEEAREALQADGWIISGKGHSVASDTETHTGRGFTATYLEI